MAKRGWPTGRGEPFDGSDRHPRVDGNNTGLVGKHGVEIELAQFGQIRSQLRQLDQQEGNRILVGSRNVAVGLEHARHAGARDQLARKFEIERGQRQRLVGDDLDCGPAAPNTMTGPKVGSSAIPAISSRALGRRIIGMDRDAGDAGVGLGGLRARQDIGDSLAHRAFAGEVEPHAADFGFVNDVRRQNLATTVEPSASSGAATAAASSASRANSAGAIGME